MAKYCRKCGCEIKDDSLFCPECGSYIKRSENKVSLDSKWILIGIAILIIVVIGVFLFTGSSKVETSLSMVSQSNFDSSTEYVVLLSDADNKPLADKFVNVEFNNDTYTLRTDSEGLAKINLTLSEGNHEVNSYFEGDEQYKESHTSNIIVI